MGRLQNKVAIVTGGASGIGQATAKILAAEGAKVVVADFNLAGAQTVAAAIKAAGGEAVATVLDATNAESVQAMVEFAHAQYGALHILHNNVGGTDVTKDLAVVDLDLDCWDKVFALCLKSVLMGCKFAIPLMIKSGGGSIINTASMSGAAGDLANTAYGVAKTGVMSLSKYVATQYGAQNIRCNAVAPSVVMTPAVEQFMPEPMLNSFKKHTLLPRLGKPEDIGYLVAFLASDEAGYITGQTIEADGGLRAHLPTTADATY
ncbi:MAG TPA: SDR family NAD(P)-dependent oxidoreductase [Spongiibacteraceae bacterium]|nr:SDR family NAD(P)-dependent oxidoreductase [Spongiibacteraceae bacterium]